MAGHIGQQIQDKSADYTIPIDSHKHITAGVLAHILKAPAQIFIQCALVRLELLVEVVNDG